MRDDKLHAVCGTKHISKSKCTKHLSFGARLKVAMSKKCAPLWREAHFEAKCTKRSMFGPLLEVAMSKKCTPLWRKAHFEVKNVQSRPGADHFWKLRCAVVARSTFRSHNVQNTPGSDHFWKLRCRKSVRCCGAKHISKSKC